MKEREALGREGVCWQCVLAAGDRLCCEAIAFSVNANRLDRSVCEVCGFTRSVTPAQAAPVLDLPTVSLYERSGSRAD